MMTTRIPGMFVGAPLLALAYPIFMRWVPAKPDTGADLPPQDNSAAG